MKATELQYWAYQAFKLAQATVSSTYQFADKPGTFGHQWLNLALEIQKHYRECDYPEDLIVGPADLNEWKPEWVNGQDGSSEVV